MLELIVFSSIIGYVITDILQDEGKPLFWFWKLINKYLSGTIIFNLLTCAMCMSGQIALWSYIFSFDFNLIDCIFTTCSSILLTKIIQKWS